MLIPHKNRINETLKNPENSLFLYISCFFCHFFTYFLSFYRFLVVLLQQRRKVSKLQEKSGTEVLKGMQSAPSGQEMIIYK